MSYDERLRQAELDAVDGLFAAWDAQPELFRAFVASLSPAGQRSWTNLEAANIHRHADENAWAKRLEDICQHNARIAERKAGAVR